MKFTYQPGGNFFGKELEREKPLKLVIFQVQQIPQLKISVITNLILLENQSISAIMKTYIFLTFKLLLLTLSKLESSFEINSQSQLTSSSHYQTKHGIKLISLHKKDHNQYWHQLQIHQYIICKLQINKFNDTQYMNIYIGSKNDQLLDYYNNMILNHIL